MCFHQKILHTFNTHSADLALPAQGCLGCQLHIQTAGGLAGPCCDFTGSRYGDRNTEAVMMLLIENNSWRYFKTLYSIYNLSSVLLTVHVVLHADSTSHIVGNIKITQIFQKCVGIQAQWTKDDPAHMGVSQILHKSAENCGNHDLIIDHNPNV